MKKLAVVMLFGLFAVGCGGKGSAGEECTSTSGCESGLTCVKEGVLTPCGADAAACNQTCQTPKSFCVKTCSSDNDCANTKSTSGATPKCVTDCSGNHFCGAAT